MLECAYRPVLDLLFFGLFFLVFLFPIPVFHPSSGGYIIGHKDANWELLEDRNLVPLLSRGLLWRSRWHGVFTFHTDHSTSLVLRRRVRALAPNPSQLSSSACERPGAFGALNHTFRLPVFHDGPIEAEEELIAILHIADESSTG